MLVLILIKNKTFDCTALNIINNYKQNNSYRLLINFKISVDN